MRRLFLPLILALGFAPIASPQSLASPYSIANFAAQTFTATNTTGAAIALNGLSSGTSTVGSSFASGNITVTGSGLTTATFQVQGSSDLGTTYYPIQITNVSTVGATPAATATVTGNGLYQVSLAGLTHVRFVTSGTFTAASISLRLSASPNAISRGGSTGTGTGGCATTGCTFSGPVYLAGSPSAATQAATKAYVDAVALNATDPVARAAAAAACQPNGTNCQSTAPSGAAGGDLAGSYPNPTVKSVNVATPINTTVGYQINGAAPNNYLMMGDGSKGSYATPAAVRVALAIPNEVVTIAMTDANYNLSPTEANARTIVVTSAAKFTANRTIVAPATAGKSFTVVNSTAGAPGRAIIFSTGTSGTGVVIASTASVSVQNLTGTEYTAREVGNSQFQYSAPYDLDSNAYVRYTYPGSGSAIYNDHNWMITPGQIGGALQDREIAGSTGDYQVGAYRYFSPSGTNGTGKINYVWPATTLATFSDIRGVDPTLASQFATKNYVDTHAGGGGSGSVTAFTAGSLSPIFTTSVANGTSTPALSFALSAQAANLVLASPDGATGAPIWRKLKLIDISDDGTMAAQNANAIAVTGGTLTGITATLAADPTAAMQAATKQYADGVALTACGTYGCPKLQVDGSIPSYTTSVNNGLVLTTATGGDAYPQMATGQVFLGLKNGYPGIIDASGFWTSFINSGTYTSQQTYSFDGTVIAIGTGNTGSSITFGAGRAGIGYANGMLGSGAIYMQGLGRNIGFTSSATLGATGPLLGGFMASGQFFIGNNSTSPFDYTLMPFYVNGGIVKFGAENRTSGRAFIDATNNTTIAAADTLVTFNTNTNATNINAILETAPALGHRITLKHTSNDAHSIVIVPPTGGTVDGMSAGNAALSFGSGAYSARELWCTGNTAGATTWVIVNGYL